MSQLTGGRAAPKPSLESLVVFDGEGTLRELTMDAIENGLAHAEKFFSGATAEKAGAKKLVR